MNKSVALKMFLVCIWLAGVVTVGLAIYYQDMFFETSHVPVAIVAEKKGAVISRSSEVIRWREVSENHEIYDGDWIATSRGAMSMVEFGPQRNIALGDDTQIHITTITQADGKSAILVRLLRGSVVPHVDESCTGCPPIIVRAGRESYTISSGQEVGIYKPVGQKAEKFEASGPWPVLDPSSVPEAFSLSSRLLTEEPTNSVVQPPPRPKLDEAKGLEVRIRVGEEGREFWTLEPLSALSSTSLRFPVFIPPRLPKVGSYRPVVEVHGTGNRSKRVEIDHLTRSDREVSVPILKIKSIASTAFRGAIREYMFSLRGGAVVSREGEQNKSFEHTPTDYVIRSLGEAPPGPLTLGLDTLSRESGDAAFLSDKSLLPMGSAFVRIHLVSHEDFPKLGSFVRGASAIGLTRQGLVGDRGIYIVRNQSIVAQISGRGSDSQSIAKVITALGGTFAFKGPKAAFHDIQGSSQEEVAAWVGDLLDKGQVLYVLKRKHLYPVNRTFIKTNREVVQFIDRQANAIFLQKVDIFDVR